MADDAFVRARDSNFSGALGSAADLQGLAVKRLELASGLAFGIGLVCFALLALRQPNVGVRAGTLRPAWVILVGVVFTGLVYAVARFAKISAERKIDFGLVWLVALSLLAGLFRHWLPYADSDVVRGFPPAVVGVVFIAVLIPVPPARMAVAGLLAVLADVLALWLTIAFVGNASPRWNLWLWLLLPNVIALPVAVLTSRLLFRLGETVRRAREMGAYKLVEKLGSGGMGEVWRADHQTLARPAAIKLVRPELLGARRSEDALSMISRFEREARATARLTSPHTIAVYDFGRAEDGAFYYVMELLDGMDLEEITYRHGGLPQERVVHLLLQVCHSLRDAHENGLIHRDIKPANLFVCQRGADRDFVKVLDFGLVKIEEAEPDAKLTEVGAIPGTPAYMAPELSQGQEASVASDVYAVGCVGYQLLTGHMMWPDRPLPMQQIFAHVQEAPPPIPAELGVDPALERAVMRCLAKTPGERPESIAALEDALRATELAEAWTAERAERWWQGVKPMDVEELGMSPTLPAP